MPFTVDIPSAAAVLGWVSVLALSAKVYYDYMQRRTERLVAEGTTNKNNADANKANADSDAAQASALATASSTAAQWMGLYSEVLQKLGEHTGLIAELRAEVQALTGQIKTLTRDLDGAQSALIICQSDLKKEQELRKAAEYDSEQYRQGWDSAMLLLEGTANGQKLDPALANVAETTIKRILDYDKNSSARSPSAQSRKNRNH